MKLYDKPASDPDLRETPATLSDLSLPNPRAMTKQGVGPSAAEGDPWISDEDVVPRSARLLLPLVDGRATMLAMCVAFLTATRSITLAAWDLYAELPLVRGSDLRAGADGSPDQLSLVARLRAAGLDEEALSFWDAGQLRVLDVLGFAARRGVRVSVLLWAPLNPAGILHIINDPLTESELLENVGVTCRLDTRSHSPLHPTQALHQKCVVIDCEIAFVGGLDLTTQHDGDFDRWDTSGHPYIVSAADRSSAALRSAPHSWHDVHLVMVGDAAQDVERNFWQRWNESSPSAAVSRRRGDQDAASRPYFHAKGESPTPLAWSVHSLIAWFAHVLTRKSSPFAAESEMRPCRTGQGVGAAAPDVIPGDPLPTSATARALLPVASWAGTDSLGLAGAPVQVTRTIPAHTYRFAPEGIQTIAQMYLRAFRAAREWVYVENQYLWIEEVVGAGPAQVGWESPVMRSLAHALLDALERGVRVVLVLPDHPNIGRRLTDASILWLRHHAPSARERLSVFTLASSGPKHQPFPLPAADTERENVMRAAIQSARPIYVHAKVAIIDDQWATVGSANLNGRGMSHDAELNVAIADAQFATTLRQLLWGEHLGCDTRSLGDDHLCPLPGDLTYSSISGAQGSQGLIHPLRHPLEALFLSTGSAAESADTPPISAEAALSAASVLYPRSPLEGIDALTRAARENLTRLQHGEPLVGHLLPYVLPSEGPSLNVRVHPERGLLAGLHSEWA
jgi:phosphatidylserine/phosphatidylglycerophosphate/cardiolipin synthase-like enzyme